MIAFALAGLAITVVMVPRFGIFLDAAASGIAAISYLSLIGYLFGVSRFYGGIMALHTGIVLGIVAITLFTLREGPGIADVAVSSGAGGVVFRRVALSIALLTPAVGLVRIKAQQVEFVDLTSGTALFVVIIVFVFTVITVGTAKKLDALDLKSRLAEQSMIRTEKLAAAGRLSASIAHEINNPLEAVTNLLYLARTVPSPETSLEYVAIAEREVRRASEIAKKTLGFYREDAKATDVNLATLMTEVLDVFHQKISSSRANIDKQIDEDAVVHARVGEMRQILVNLVSNALEAANGASPKIVCSTRQNSATRTIDILITDNGKGISSENRVRLFQPFFTTKESVGTGLGLYVSKQLAEKNGGVLCLESSTPGTTFRLTLPLAKRLEIN
jgi:signal transduction histidine kinase